MNSKKRLVFAIRDLMNHKSINKITVDMIIQKSDVSRTTFYRYFTDKYALMTEYYNYSIDQILSDRNKNYQSSMVKVLNFMKENHEYFLSLSQQNGEEEFFHLFCRISEKNTIDIIKEKKHSSLTQNELDAISFWVGGAGHICQIWFNNGMKRDPNKIANIIGNCIPEEIRCYINTD